MPGFTPGCGVWALCSNASGTKLEPGAFKFSSISKKIDNYLDDIKLIKCLDAKTSIPILKSCIISRANYLARVMDPEDMIPHAKRLDEAVDLFLGDIINMVLDSNAKLIRKLPESDGGLGLYGLSDILYPASVSSYLSAFNYANRHSDLNWNDVRANWNGHFTKKADIIRKYFPNFSLTTFMGENPKQKDLSKLLYAETKNQIIDALHDNPSKKAWFLASKKAPWMNSIFFKSRFCNFPNVTYVSNIKTRLLRMQTLCNICPCGLEQNVDLNCFHGLSCNFSEGEEIRRHDSITAVIKMMLDKYVPNIHTSTETRISKLGDISSLKKSDICVSF